MTPSEIHQAGVVPDVAVCQKYGRRRRPHSECRAATRHQASRRKVRQAERAIHEPEAGDALRFRFPSLIEATQFLVASELMESPHPVRSPARPVPIHRELRQGPRGRHVGANGERQDDQNRSEAHVAYVRDRRVSYNVFPLSSPGPEWRNWQTRGTQNQFTNGECGFNSLLRHQDLQ